MFSKVAQAAIYLVSEVTGESYDLVILDDENVPLAGAPQGESAMAWWGYLLLIIGVAIIVGVVIYALECGHYYKRLSGLCMSAGESIPGAGRWNLGFMKTRIEELESAMASRMEITTT